MSLTRGEKLSYVGAPFLFGMVLIICGIIMVNTSRFLGTGNLLICAGLVCMSLYCVCALLAKLISGK